MTLQASELTAKRRRLIYVSERLKLLIEEQAALKAERQALTREIAAMQPAGTDPS